MPSYSTHEWLSLGYKTVGIVPKVAVGIFHQCYHCDVQNLHIATQTVWIQTFVLSNENFVLTNCIIYLGTDTVQLVFFILSHWG